MFFINSYKPELKESLRSKGLDPDDFDILMVVAGFLWSLAVGMALAHGLFKNDRSIESERTTNESFSSSGYAERFH